MHAGPCGGVSRQGHRVPLGTRRTLCPQSGGDRVMHGLRQIVRFNWPFYVVGTTVVIATGLVIAQLPVATGIRSLLYSATGLAAFWLVGSLAASWVVYDRSRLTKWDWIRDAVGFPPRAWL